MYNKDLNVKINLRLDQEVWDFICGMSEELKITPSAFIRTTMRSLQSSMKGLVDSHVVEQSHINHKL